MGPCIRLRAQAATATAGKAGRSQSVACEAPDTPEATWSARRGVDVQHVSHVIDELADGRLQGTIQFLRGCSCRKGRSHSCASKLSSTHRTHTRSTVEPFTSESSTISSSVKRDPHTFVRLQQHTSVRQRSNRGLPSDRYACKLRALSGGQPHTAPLLLPAPCGAPYLTTQSSRDVPGR